MQKYRLSTVIMRLCIMQSYLHAYRQCKLSPLVHVVKSIPLVHSNCHNKFEGGPGLGSWFWVYKSVLYLKLQLSKFSACSQSYLHACFGIMQSFLHAYRQCKVSML
jgi:hypothetical protein